MWRSRIMKMRRITPAAALVIVMILLGLCALFSCRERERGVELVSWLVRDCVVWLESPEIRSRVIAGFRVRPGISRTERLKVHGELFHNDVIMARASLLSLDGPAGSLEFDLPGTRSLALSRETPYSIPEGIYKIRVMLMDGHGRILSETGKTLPRDQLCRTFRGRGHRCPPAVYRAVPGAGRQQAWSPSAEDLDRGYALFRNGPLDDASAVPRTDDGIDLREIDTFVSRNEVKTLTFSVRSITDTGTVRVSVSPFRAGNGIAGKLSVKVSSAGLLTRVDEGGKPEGPIPYRLSPRILEPDPPLLKGGGTVSFWLTLRSTADTLPGEYTAALTVTPERGRRTEIPLRVTVLPLTLTDTDIQYGMMMDYAFYELDSGGWADRERKILARWGAGIYRDMREHGMTMVYPHSRFVYAPAEDGTPPLESLGEALVNYRKMGFPGPFCWYMGHLLHTAKTLHPGSILLYDEAVAERRLRSLLRRFQYMARESGVPRERLLVQLVDEPDGEDRARVAAAKRLHAVAREMGFRTLITRPWPEAAVMCTFPPESDAEASRLRSMGNEWWIYPNEALEGRNLCRTRYVFGFGAWRWGVKGVAPWTYQMSQGSNGNPFTVLDGPEIMVTYPGREGVLSTPVWEAVREGINDYRYIYRLERLIASARKRKGSRAGAIERRLLELKRAYPRAPGAEGFVYGDWPPDSFEKRRRDIIDWACKLYDESQRNGAAF